MHQPVIGGPPAHAQRAVVFATLPFGDQNLDDAAELCSIFGPRDVFGDRDQPLVPISHDIGRHLIGHVGGRRTRTFRVLKSEATRETSLPDDVECVLEISFGFTGKSDDDVGGDRGVRHRLAHPRNDAEVFLLAVRTAHPFEHVVRTRLQRHVQLVHDVRRFGHRGDDVVGEIARMR